MIVRTEDYLAKIAPEHANKSKFVATVGLSVHPYARLQAAFRKLAVGDFDLDEAIGPQLDAVGVRVGRSRIIPIPLQGLFFSWGDPARGWGSGLWKGKYDVGNSLYQLDDTTFRRLIRAKIAANGWDGTINGQEAIYRTYFTDPTILVFVSDDAVSVAPRKFFTWGDPNRGWGSGEWAPPGASGDAPPVSTVDMKMTVGFAGKVPSAVDLAIINEGLVGAKPEGVTVQCAVTSVNGAPLFGWGVQNEFISGWGSGAWATTPSALLARS